MNPRLKASIIKKYREITDKNLDEETLKKQRKFMDWLVVHNYNPDVKFLEMYPGEEDTIKSFPEMQYPNKYVNTRTKILSSTRAEIDSLEFEKAMQIICSIIQSLMTHKIHFAVFYAIGQRSPHVIIYDFEELKELDPFQRIKAQIEFWRKIAPWSFHYLDKGVFEDDHLVPLEFSIHWKYKTLFDLIMEWKPEEEKCKD